MDEMELLEQFCAEQPPPDPRRLQAARNQLTRHIAPNHPGRTDTPTAPGRRAEPPRQLRYARRSHALAAGIVTATVIGLTVTAAVMTTGPSRQYLYTVVRQVPGRVAPLVQTWQSPDGRRGAVRWTNCYTSERVLRSCLLKLDNGREAPIPPDRTYAGLQTLPTKPRVLLAYLIRHSTCNATGQRLPPAQAAYQEAMMILDTVSVLPRRTGAALFEALASIPGISVIHNASDAAGGHGVAVQMTFQAPHFALTRHELIFNRRTYQYIGSQRITVNASHGRGTILSASSLVTSRIVNSAPTNYTTWPSRSGKKPVQTGTPSCGA